jgi:glycosyltransferase involved in cell wall biosynthesis
LKIAFVCEYDMQDPFQRSGVPYFIAEGFKKLGHEVIQIGPFDNRRKLYHRIWNSIFVLIFNKLLQNKWGSIHNLWSKEYLQNYSIQAEEKLKGLDVDLVFSPEAHTIAYLNTDKPIVFWRDSTFENLLDYYPEFSNIHPICVRQGHNAEKSALQKAALAVYTSDWAAKSAIEFYGAKPEKILLVGRGANLFEEPKEVEELIANRSKLETLKILFIGANWNRKGGDKVFETVSLLNELGVKTEMHAIGEKPKMSNVPIWLHHHGYLKKSEKSDYQQIKNLYAECHFFMMPSHAENFGIVYAEASAYGLPCVASNTGGVSSAVKHLANGLLFEPSTHPNEIAKAIRSIWDNKTSYIDLCRKSRMEYETRLNWETNCKIVIQQYIEKFGV